MSKLLDDMGKDLLLSTDELERLIKSAPYRYKVFQIPKRTPGQVRTIAQPAREIKDLQRWVDRRVLRKLPHHRAATAYRKGKSILHNARVHASGRYLLKMDFSDFFPSITGADVSRYLRRARPDLDSDDVSRLIRILTWRPMRDSGMILAIGAPSSPTMSNLLMFRFDTLVAQYCRQVEVTYTRYADDLSFSAQSSESLRAVEAFVIATASESRTPRLTINDAKTVRASRRDSRRVTGLVLTNDNTVSLGRETKRRLRAAVFNFTTQPADVNTETRREELRGWLAYADSVEPAFVMKLRARFGNAATNLFN